MGGRCSTSRALCWASRSHPPPTRASLRARRCAERHGTWTIRSRMQTRSKAAPASAEASCRTSST
eukprot:740773-Rhodomonas_salina.1